MNVLNPDLVWVQGRCYRNFEGSAWAANKTDEFYVENDEEVDNDEENGSDDDILVESHEESKFKHTFRLSKNYFRYVVGVKNSTRKRIESETKTRIAIPKPGLDGDIVIVGPNRKCVVSARRRIDLIIASTKNKLQPTHFLSIPLHAEGIVKNFESFKKVVLDNYGKTTRGIEENLFQIPSKLHITLGMLTLMDDDERKVAVETLENCAKEYMQPFLAKHGTITIKLKGVDSMTNDPSKTHVLYAKIYSQDTILQTFVDGVIDYFAKKDLIRRKTENVKLHVTLMNSQFPLYRDETYKGKRQTFDAKEIISAHKETVFGEITLNELHLSQRHTVASNGYYQSSATIKFP